jgi:hypothetical protein
MPSLALKLSSLAPSVPNIKAILLVIPQEFFPFSKTERTSKILSQHLDRILLENLFPEKKFV